MVVAGANMQWDRFVCPSCGPKRESTAFELILQSIWGLLSPAEQVGRSSTSCWKRSQVWDRESEWWPKYNYAAKTPVLEMGRIFFLNLSPLRLTNDYMMFIL